MTRPRKQTVDYFPHSCHHGKTIFILEQRYGVHGYAFWFKLLELLGSSEGHYFDCNNPADWEYLQGKTEMDEPKCQEILDLLSKLDAIDSELWEAKVIWSENFVKGITDAYRNRRVEPPKRPDNYINKSTSEEITTCSLQVDNRKLNETKLNETKLNKDIPPRQPKKPKPQETTIPDDFQISIAVQAWAGKHGFSQLEDHLESFKDYALSRGKRYADWDSAFKRAVREDWAKLRSGNGGVSRQPPQLNKADQITAGNLAARERVLKKLEQEG